jgi:hypothetical protein
MDFQMRKKSRYSAEQITVQSAARPRKTRAIWKGTTGTSLQVAGILFPWTIYTQQTLHNPD